MPSASLLVYPTGAQDYLRLCEAISWDELYTACSLPPQQVQKWPPERVAVFVAALRTHPAYGELARRASDIVRTYLDHNSDFIINASVCPFSSVCTHTQMIQLAGRERAITECDEKHAMRRVRGRMMEGNGRSTGSRRRNAHTPVIKPENCMKNTTAGTVTVYARVRLAAPTAAPAGHRDGPVCTADPRTLRWCTRRLHGVDAC